MLDSTQKSIAIATALLPTTTTITTNTRTKLATAKTPPFAEKTRTDTHRHAKAITTTTPTNSTTSAKAKTIFSWLKSATKSFDSAAAECNNSNNGANSNKGGFGANNKNNKNNNNNSNIVSVNSVDTECSRVSVSGIDSVAGVSSAEYTCDSIDAIAVADADVVVIPEATTAAPARAKSPDTTLREFRGVQSLRHLWNKRISALEESRYRSFGQGKGSKLTKSIGCLVNATSDAPPTKEQVLRQRHSLQTKRAQSLYDCTQLDEGVELQQQAPTTNEAQIELLHREKDNFYKYKTAEQAAKHLAREAQVRSGGSKTRRSNAGIVVSTDASEDAHFPAVKASERGERIHWLKRRERERERATQSTKAANCNHANMAISDKRVIDRDATRTTTSAILSLNEAVISTGCAADICQVKTMTTGADNQSELSLSLTSSDNENETNTSDTLTAANSPQHASRTRVTVRDTTTSSNSISNANTKRGSTDSSSTGSSVTLARTPRRTSSTSTRKYSFKTHVRSYHASRKMNNTKEGSCGGSSAASAANGFSMVAKLTQQFNEIIQKDKSLLAEVKRKNGVIMSRGGHVYKVLETSELNKTATLNTGRSSTVQRNIQKFECSSGEGAENADVAKAAAADVEKPKVPAKSLHVLRKRHEFVSHMSQPSSKRVQLSLPLQNGLPTELHLKRTQISLPPLEMVKEEAKTPLEQEERSILAVVATANAATSAELYVPKVQSAQCTYSAAQKSSDNENLNTPNEMAAAIKANCMRAAAQSQRQTQSSADNGAAEGEVAVEVAVQAQLEAATTELAVPLLNLQCEERPKCATVQHSVAAANDADVQTLPPCIASAAIAVTTANVAESVTLGGDTNANANADGDADADAPSDEKLKQRKHKYAKIYEKFRFRSPFSKSPEKKATKTTTITTTNADEVKSPATTEIAIAGPEPEAKLLYALGVIDQKLKGLNGDLTAVAAITPIVLCENDDFEQLVLPNNSFVYQANAKQVCNNELIVTQAVNVALVNSIEGEQMIMEQKELQQQAANARLLAEALNKALVQKFDQQNITNLQEDAKQALCAEQEEVIYEPINAAKEPKTEELQAPPTFLYKVCGASSKASNNLPLPTVTSSTQSMEDVYQTVEEAQQTMCETVAAVMVETELEATTPAPEVANLLNDYESIAGSCEQAVPAQSTVTKPSSYFDGYEICEPPPDEPPLPTTQPPAIVRNTNDELPELPKPKRRLPKSPMPGKRPPKPAAFVVDNAVVAPAIPMPTMLELLDDNDDHHYYADDENIYDTIKGSHCYESLHSECLRLQKSSSSTKGSDSVSLTSNCYESISHYRRLVINGGHITGSSSGSTLTISSDHKTNSLYEMSLAAGLLYGAGSLGFGCSPGGHNSSTGTGVANSDCDGRSRIYCHSIAASSDNSDAWIDISDAEPEGGSGELSKQQFIVVRERSKVHRSPDWSKRIRDKRLQQKKAMSCIEDDSDHYYESLSPLGNKRHSTQLVQRSNSHHKRNQDLPRLASNATRCSKKYSASAHALGTGISDDYDSFDTDTDEIYETEHLKNQNDSGVDICHVKLPDPPPSTNQVYAIVRKFKNFISNKKSPSSNSKLGGSQQKIYENTSQFYVEGNVYENTPKAKSKSHKTAKKLPVTPAASQRDDIYENTEFHSPPLIIEAVAKPLSTSEKNLSVHGSNAELLGNATTMRPKSKASKSFKSRLRKSVGGSIFDSKQLSTLTPTRSTFYIEDPSHGGSGELDSGFSEKASSGDLPVAPVQPTPDTQKFSTVARKAKKEAKAANAQRRRTTIGIRPHEPPPPPPSEEATLRVKQQSNTSGTTTTTTTSWYAECGVFKHGPGNFPHDEHSLSGSKSTHSQSGSMTTTGNSWYAEAGLYQTSGISVASSSGSSGVSTGNECGVGDDTPHSIFLNEPLYQIYSAEKLESISRDMEDHDGSTDGYEEVGQHRTGLISEDSKKRSRPSALQLVGPKNGPSRTLWSEIPEVINSCILPTLTPRERGLQEAKFEIITSEASYLKSLNLLRSHFMNHPLFRDTSLVCARDRKALFAYIVPVHECSERLLTQLESCWQDSIMLLGLSRRIYAIAEKYFHVYIAFCEHQGRMDRTLRRLKEAKGMFSQNLDLLEASTTCCGLNLHSFLMLPMQRITRLPLLIDAVFSKVSPHDDEYDSWKMTLAIMNKIVTQCNEAANRCEQAYEIERISRQLEFPSSIRALAIAPVGVSAPGSKPRFLVKKGELTHLIWRGDDVKLTFGKKFTKSNIYAFLFSDLLVITKRKAEELFQVFDYCPRSMLTITSGDALPQLPTKDINHTGRNLILMTLLENHERKTIELVLSCPSVSEQQRWLQAMRPPEPEMPGEKLYEQWDCPQVIAKHEYEAKEPDLLNLEVGDVVNVSRKLPDGWYQGERIRDGAIGWFPGSYAEEVNSAHVRARNLKQRHRLLTFTATYLESQKRK